MTPPQEEDVTITRGSLKTIAAALTIIVILLTGMGWVFTVASTASEAKAQAKATADALEHKADKDDLKEMRQDIKDIRDFLLNSGGKK